MATNWERNAIAAGVFIGRVRALQEAHARAHAALVNWGDWSADRRGIFPRLSSPALWDQIKRSELDEYGEEQPPAVIVDQGPAKSEAPEAKPHDEKSAISLDERIHGYGGLPVYVRYAIKAAYVTREIPEDQFPRAAGCNEDAFCERLAEALAFVGRFA